MLDMKDAQEYYKAIDVDHNLNKIKNCPTMFLQAYDDLIASSENFPYEEA